MPAIRDIRRVAGATARGVRATASGTSRVSGWVSRTVGSARRRGGVGNVGMMRLLDLHALSCAGDTLITIGLAGTIFFNVAPGEARGRVALYLLVTMVPFALLAPVVGPTLDRFRHGRRYALAATFLGRAILAWVIADNVVGFALYPAAFGVLAFSRAYGVARSAAVPRLLPPGLGLSQAGARASVYGTVAGAIVAPLGAIAFALGAQWPLRVATFIFLAGVVVSFRLPPKADSDPPEVVPKAFQLPWRHRAENGDRVLSGRLIVATLIGSACMRALYGFLLLFLAFAIRSDDVPDEFLGISFSPAAALGLVGGSMALGTFLSTAIGTRLRIRRPVWLQAVGLTGVAIMGLWATVHFTLTAIVGFCLFAAVASGLAKLAVDASIQEKIPEHVRASAYAHAETLLMLAWVVGGAIGLVPLDGHVGVAIAALAVVAAAVRAGIDARRLRTEVLRGRAAAPQQQVRETRPLPTEPLPTTATRTAAAPTTAPATVVVPQPAPVPAGDHDDIPPGYHVFRPSSPDNGVTDPRTGA